ncbi:RNA polymerase sigma factor, sigma-70 family [Dyadobacter soli]|uniref:RNA polymerase sigma factor, sigma-70 family n=1 Tax=Dyadobacter soli TaxID=659014 RepID=A0A1G7VLV2_9BACT|nr:sigma-70 family RNA polymerase sigma factor [Dyadobacter soli]SDG60548.1 RNA polymerase sigma factor, sigma-70 family [Dyadobacter soli]
MIADKSDIELWELFTSGSQTAFGRLYDKYADLLYAFGLRYTSDTDMVKDCIQDLFIDLLHYRDELAKDVNVRYYLLKSFKRKLYTASKKAAIFSLNEWDLDDKVVSRFSFSAEQDIIGDERQLEMLQALAVEINKLPERQKEILYLKFTHNLDYEEIASMMQISVPTCRTFVYRAIKELRGKLEISAILLILWTL